MGTTTETLNCLAIAVGTVLAYGLGMIWFSPAMFGKRWSRGTNNLQPPEKAPLLVMACSLRARSRWRW